MSGRIKFFRDAGQARETHQFLNTHGIKSYTRERNQTNTQQGEEAFGVDLFVLKEDDVPEAKQLLDYTYGVAWGENVST